MDNKNTVTIATPDILLFIVFLVLKLCGVIGWSWWWVCAPLWIPTALIISVATICILFLGIFALGAFIYNCFI